MSRIIKAGPQTPALTQLLANRVKDEASPSICEQNEASNDTRPCPLPVSATEGKRPHYTFINNTPSELRQKAGLSVKPEGYGLAEKPPGIGK